MTVTSKVTLKVRVTTALPVLQHATSENRACMFSASQLVQLLPGSPSKPVSVCWVTSARDYDTSYWQHTATDCCASM